ncbi:MAG TPA: transglutaminase family protein [Pirellulales bacterium]|nr:transglutaminase family protein [Pirellulales bacterium]
MIRVALNHKTLYRYDRPVTIFPQVVRLRPAPHCRTPIMSYSLSVEPRPHFLNWQQDTQANYLARLVFPKPAGELSIEVDLVAEMTVINPFDFFLEPAVEKFPFVYDDSLAAELKPFRAVEPAGARMQAYLDSIDRAPLPTNDFLVALNQRLQRDVRYLIRMDPGVQSCEQTLTLASGSCRDTAWLLVQVLRNLGLAARFVSGYLIQLTSDVKSLDGPSGPEHDFTDLHAWTEVYLPGAGWIGLDPTSGLFAGEGHIPLACTAEPSSAAPVSGSVEPCETTFDVTMSVQRIHEDPRVTKPYRDDEWQAIERLGHRIDAELEAGAVRLTMGGEPTFVSIDDMDGLEWNFDALGPTKRPLAGDLLARIEQRFAPGGLLHYGQGKWYPGEPLPRWALGCYWRKDGVPIWHDRELLANERTDYRHGPAEARAFVSALAERLGVSPELAVPAYEDVWHYIRQERKLPVNVDPLDARLDDPLERARLARVFERGLGEVAGYALPLRPSDLISGPRWLSGRWSFRQERMYLVPGDSPLGLRLPLESLPWSAPEDRELVQGLDPFEPRGPLAVDGEASDGATTDVRQAQRYVNREGNGRPAVSSRAGAAAAYAGSSRHGGQAGWSALDELEPAASAGADLLPQAVPELGHLLEQGQSARQVVRTALCVEPRQGRLHVFMPPVRRLEHYLELVAAVEETARELSLPIVVEGYPPPHDHRMNHIKVTPDPGVIEVNVHPAHSWNELVRNTTVLYDEARQARLGTEKFMLDGKHSGTGGGNHVVLGGPTPADSPFLRRPDLLRSLLAYWNNHPALSYLFSGTFIGPTSQAPRIDEARHESLYELEIAFQQLPDSGDCPPWLVDRVFRHLLTDLTGNTHRAEFCIDKLYSPDTAAGRLGLVEFRAFEMPPHARMSLTQQLLLRALIAWFWKQPYRRKLVRWGTGLHDRYLLPHFVSQDIRDVIDELRAAGYAFCPKWFDAQFEFRFPFYGEATYSGVRIELRSAIEPWNVLGEEPGPGGTARYVDSSVERLQVRVEGMTEPRHIVTCNGRRVPLHPTGTAGEFVAGVRYRAWQPPTCLHPTIPVHTPLVFDLYDTWAGRSMGGCTWHVSHPGGRHYDGFPVNAYEAESRRAARFFKHGHTPGPTTLAREELNPQFPLTLDLRRTP